MLNLVKRNSSISYYFRLENSDTSPLINLVKSFQQKYLNVTKKAKENNKIILPNLIKINSEASLTSKKADKIETRKVNLKKVKFNTNILNDYNRFNNKKENNFFHSFDNSELNIDEKNINLGPDFKPDFPFRNKHFHLTNNHKQKNVDIKEIINNNFYSSFPLKLY